MCNICQILYARYDICNQEHQSGNEHFVKRCSLKLSMKDQKVESVGGSDLSDGQKIETAFWHILPILAYLANFRFN